MNTTKEEAIQFLKKLQQQMQYEDANDYDSQASPRFWVIMDYKDRVTSEGFEDRQSYFHSDGDYTEFKELDELKKFLTDHFLPDDEFGGLKAILESPDTDFDDLWEFTMDHLNDDGVFNDLPVSEESFICPDTMFLTKKEAKAHLASNKHHYTSKAHTYAMTAWRSPSMQKLNEILLNFNWEQIDSTDNKEGVHS